MFARRLQTNVPDAKVVIGDIDILYVTLSLRIEYELYPLIAPRVGLIIQRLNIVDTFNVHIGRIHIRGEVDVRISTVGIRRELLAGGDGALPDEMFRDHEAQFLGHSGQHFETQLPCQGAPDTSAPARSIGGGGRKVVVGGGDEVGRQRQRLKGVAPLVEAGDHAVALHAVLPAAHVVRDGPRVGGERVGGPDAEGEGLAGAAPADFMCLCLVRTTLLTRRGHRGTAQRRGTYPRGPGRRPQGGTGIAGTAARLCSNRRGSGRPWRAACGRARGWAW